MNYAILEFGMVMRVVRQGARDGLRGRYPKIVYDVAMSGMWKIGVDDVLAEIGAVATESVEMVHIWCGIELRDQIQVLLPGGLDDENVNGSFRRGAHHFPPFRFLVGLAGVAGAVIAQHFLAVFRFQQVFDFSGGKKGPIFRIRNAVQIHIQRHNIPLERSEERRVGKECRSRWSTNSE